MQHLCLCCCSRALQEGSEQLGYPHGYKILCATRAVDHAEMLQYSSGVRGDRHHLIDVPLLADGNISKVNITISQRPDGSDWLLGVGSSGKVSPQLPRLQKLAYNA